MKLFAFSLLIFLYVGNLPAQNLRKGSVEVVKFLSPSIQGNPAGEDPVRRLTIYLPPGYRGNNLRYPVLYFLHGFISNDSLTMAYNRFKQLMDSAIFIGRLRPMILVLPNSYTKFGGSHYTNSVLTGNWADYIGKDVVDYIDKNYRTRANRNSRGLSGHSIGGSGALKIGMLYSDVFGAVYALSPAFLNWGAEFSLTNPAFKNIGSFRNEFSDEQILSELFIGKREKLYTRLIAGLARTYSPSTEKNSLSANMPVSYVGDSMLINIDIAARWEANFPINMIEKHASALKQLNALKIDWGRNEEFPDIPISALQFSKRLEIHGIKHFAEEYLGGHVNKLRGLDGRLFTELLPFFNVYLNTEPEGWTIVR